MAAKKKAGTRKRTARNSKPTTARRKVAASRKKTKTAKRKTTASRKATKTAARKSPAASSRKKATKKKTTTRRKAAPAVTKRVAKVRGKAAKSARASTNSKPMRPRPPSTRGTRLTDNDIAIFRAQLLDKRREIIGDVTAIQDEALNRNKQEAAGNLSNMPQHMADIGSDNFEQELSLVLVEGERAILREVDEALERIENGTFGVCAATGNPIGKARLRAKPWAKYCYEYVLAQETRQVRRF